MEVETMQEGEINDEAGEEVEMEDMGKYDKSKKRVAGETGPEWSSEEELMAQFSTVRSRENQRNR
jgi:hypothetical protein